MPCRRPDVREFDGVRTCLACGEFVFDDAPILNNKDENTSAETTSYRYRELDYAFGQEIRIMVLHSGMQEEPLRCEILHVNLEDELEYEAVSYTWATEDGDASLSRRIDVTRGLYHVPITVNCETILRQLRRPGSKRKLWVDAICIDQANINERNHQVGIMDRIYSKALCVRVCIPDTSDRSSSPDYGLLFKHIRKAEHMEPKSNEVRRFFSLYYFQRAWVVQELALARSAILLVNGHELLLSAPILVKLRSWYQARRWKIPGPLLWNPGSYQLGLSSDKDIFACLYATYDSQAADERDRIYAIVSLMEDPARSFIPIDYHLSLEVIYANVVAAIVASRQNLAVIRHMAQLGTTKDIYQAVWNLMRYVLSQSGFEYVDAGTDIGVYLAREIAQFGDAKQLGPWKSKVKAIKIAAFDEADGGGTVASADTSRVIFEEPVFRFSLSIVPRFRVRAHYLDTIEKLQSKAGSSWFMTPDSVAAGLHNENSADRWLIPFFRDLPVDLADPAHGVNEADLRAFITVWGAHYRWPSFSTRYSVGFAWRGFSVDDEIFAVDGATSPWVLRKTSQGVYKVITECYLWAALELDAWNPGTRKGRWGDGVVRPDVGGQTRVIEINFEE